jgi:DNA/RNA-binding domain of Phe-tRNA-synthetase-like protein
MTAMCIGMIRGIRNQRKNEWLNQLKRVVYGGVIAKQRIAALKDNLVVRAYRDFYWKLDIDPTKTRPSGEALLRRVLNGNELPSISTVVDAYNLASMETIIPISGFDMDCLKPPLRVRFARNEAFTGIGIDKTVFLGEKMLVLTDEMQVLCVYPYRDSDFTKISLQTQNVLIVGYGVPGIGRDSLKEAVEKTLDYIRGVSGGEIERVKVYGKSEEG